MYGWCLFRSIIFSGYSPSTYNPPAARPVLYPGFMFVRRQLADIPVIPDISKLWLLIVFWNSSDTLEPWKTRHYFFNIFSTPVIRNIPITLFLYWLSIGIDIKRLVFQHSTVLSRFIKVDGNLSTFSRSNSPIGYQVP